VYSPYITISEAGTLFDQYLTPAYKGQTTVAQAAAQLPVGYLVPGSSGGQPQFNLMAAGNLVFIVPVMVVFFIGQRYFVQGIVTSGLKG
jgi:multiple sugar transport system permease protein